MNTPFFNGAEMPLDETLVAANNALARHEPYYSDAINMSSIGGECWRKIWYEFRHVKPYQNTAKNIKQLENRQAVIDMVKRRLSAVCRITPLYDYDPERSIQDISGHYNGKVDGVIHGLLQAAKTPHLLSIRVSSKWKGLQRAANLVGEKKALRHWNEDYYAHAITAMDYTGFKRHYTVAVDEGANSWFAVRTNEDKSFAKYLKDKAAAIAFTETAPDRVGDPNYFKCHKGMCHFRSLCHGYQLPKRECRNCIHSTAEKTGGWSCDVGMDLNVCGEHRFLPSLIKGDQIDVANGAIIYQLQNGKEFADNGKA